MRRTKEDAEKTRLAILAAAEELFLERGVAHTSLEQIAREAGVTRGAVYWHFENKAQLFHALLSQVRLPLEQMTERFNGNPGEDALQTLANLCIEALEGLVLEPQKRRIFTILLHRCEFTDELRDAEIRHESFINDFINLVEQQFCQPDIRQRLRPEMTPALAARALHAMIVGLFSDWLRDPELFDPLKHGRIIIDSFIAGLVQQPKL